jgi:hypothetical protein
VRALGILLAPILFGANLTIDHGIVGGKDLKAMEANLAAIGLHCEYGGPHSNATEMALVSFPDGSYLGLIALRPNADQAVVAANPWAKEWAKQMEGNAGPCAWATRTKDVAAEVKRLQASGVTVSTPEKSGRVRPDGVRVDWETAQIGREPRGTFFPFLIRDITPRQQRVYLTGKPTTKDFNGVTRVVIVVRDLDESIKRYRAAYNLQPAIKKQVDAAFGAQLALLGGRPVVLASPLRPDSWLWERLEKFGEGPCAFVLGVRKRSPYTEASKTRWFDADISWFDDAKLGWHLGFE